MKKSFIGPLHLPALALLACTLLPAHAADAPPALPTDAAGWSALALHDVDAMHALLRDQTPIPFDTENPAYGRWLEQGHAEARARSAAVKDRAGYFFTLTAYAYGFRDPHIGVAVADGLPSTRWAGFIATLRGDAMVVVQRDASDSAAPAVGARIESCDGQSPAALAQARIFTFRFPAGTPDRWALPALFFDNNPFLTPLARCMVRTDGQLAPLVLTWRPMTNAQGTAYRDTVVGPSATWGLSEPAPGVFWIGVPTFSLFDSEVSQKLQALVDAVKARGETLRRARAIVIDTRGNQGGSTLWSQRLVEAIFTPAVLSKATAMLPKRRVGLDRRVSRDNIAALRADEQRAGAEARQALQDSQKPLLRDLARALEHAQPLWRQGSKSPTASGGLAARPLRNAPAPFLAQVYFLSNGSCMSTCLSFADTALMVPGVRFIGSTTFGDTPYSEVRDEKLPSGIATLRLPTLVQRGRGRGALEAYVPDIPYDGAWDDASVRAWVMERIAFGR